MKNLAPEDLYKTKSAPYYIFGLDYTENSSGIRVLHLLCHILNKLGFESYIKAEKLNPSLWTPRLEDYIIENHYKTHRKPIVIYPEVVPGSPLGLGIKVRYLLNKPGFIGGDNQFDPEELIFAYQDIFFGETGAKRTLLIPASDISKFNPHGTNQNKRSGSYFYHNRLIPRGGKLLPITENSIEISPRNPRSLDELSKIFKSAEVLYCYEYSSIATEAQLCGCPVVYIPNEVLLPKFPGGPFGRDGAAWGTSEKELAHARATVGNVYDTYLSLYEKFNQEITDFIKITQEEAINTSFEKCFPEETLISKGWSKQYQKDLAYKNWLDINQKKINHLSSTEKSTSHKSTPLTIGISTHDNADQTETTLASIKNQDSKANEIKIISDLQDFKKELKTTANQWTLILCAGDKIADQSLEIISIKIQKIATKETLVIYFDHDELNEKGVNKSPVIKPEFNYDLLLSYTYIGRSLICRTQWLESKITENTTLGLVFAQQIALAAFREKGERAFAHIPMVLAHLTPSEPHTFVASSAAWQALAKNLNDHFEICEPGTQILEGPAPGSFHIVPPLSRTPLVSIVITTCDEVTLLSRCIESLLSETNYPAFEILVVDNDSKTAEAREFLAGLAALGTDQIRVLSAPGPFNFSRMNNLAVAQARGEFILLLSNDTAALQADWLSHMVRHALRDGVGMVGARLLYPDGKVQHAGVIMGLRGPAEHPCLGLDNTEPGYLFRAQVTQNFSAVTAACMLVSKAVYEEVGGLDETTFAVSYNDIDFCLRVGKTGRRIVWTPLATLLHEGSASQKASIEATSLEQKSQRFTREQAAMYERWPEVIANDPAYNPNLSLVENGYEVETNPLLCHDPLQGLVEHRVVAFAADPYGCGHYRILQPMQAMLDAGLCSGGSSPEYFGPNLALRSGADCLVLQRPGTSGDLTLLESLLPLKGIRKIYEIDDDLARVPFKSAHHGHMPKDIRARMIRSIGLCDRLVVSTEPLAHALRGSNDDIRVVQNRLPHAMWGEQPPQRPPREGDKNRRPVIGWAGGAGHRGDLELIAELVKATADQVDWEFFGMCPDVIRPHVKVVHQGVPTLEYPARLMEITANWDLAVAPLEVNAFNESKSNLRLLEYGWCGLPVVCSDVTPYQGNMPVTRVKNRYKDWRNAITRALEDLPGLHQQGLQLQAQIQAEWTLKGEWLQAWYHAWTDE